MKIGACFAYVTLVVLSAVLCTLPLASAALTIEPLDAVHNIGDDFTVKLTATRSVAVYDFLTVHLVCPQGSVEIYKTPLSVGAGEQKDIVIPARLDRFLLNGLQGQCHIKAFYGGEDVQSPSFEITSEVIIRVSISDSLILPGAPINITGIATKRNGAPLEGIAQITIADINSSSSIPIRNGAFNTSFIVPSAAHARAYTTTIEVHDYDASGYPLNGGTTAVSFSVPAVPTALDIAVETLNVAPGTNFTASAQVYDQAGEPMTASIVFSISDPSQHEVAQINSATNMPYVFRVAQNATPGVWMVRARHGALESVKAWHVSSVETISVSVLNGLLTITNTGNVPYQQTIDVGIGDEKKSVAVALPVGASKRLQLTAPDGEYPISVADGNQSLAAGSTFLTGNSISVRDNDSLVGSVAPWVWWVLLIIIASAAAIYTYRKASMQPFFGRMPAAPESVVVSRAMASSSPPISESGKQECAIVAIHIGNVHQLETAHDHAALDTLARIARSAESSAARLYIQGAQRVGIFSPRSGENPAARAVAFAQEIETILNDHNKRHALKIVFGIGVNKGHMFIEHHEGTPKFTSVGTTVVAAKRLAEQAKEIVLLSDEAHHGLTGTIKATKQGTAWRLLSQTQRTTRDSDFINRFKKRQAFS